MCMSMLAVVHVVSAGAGLEEQGSIMTHDAKRSAAQSRSGPEYGIEDGVMTPKRPGLHCPAPSIVVITCRRHI